MLLALWADVGSKMKSMLEAYSLADLTDITRGGRAWPGESTRLTVTTTVRAPGSGRRASGTSKVTCRPCRDGRSERRRAWRNGRSTARLDRSPAVQRISDHGMSDRAAVDADLVGPTGLELAREEADDDRLVVLVVDRVVGARRPAVDGDGHAEGVTAGPADRRIDHAPAVLGMPPHQGGVGRSTAWVDSWSTRSA